MPPLPHFISIDEWGANDERFLEVNIRPEARWRLFLIVPLFSMIYALMWWRIDGAMAFGLLPLFVAGVYGAAVQFANTTHLYVSHGSLVVSSSPFPWVRREIPAADIQQLWVSEVKDKHGNSTYRLCARTTNKVVILADTHDDPGGALHLERRIEERLGIVDVPVAGEIDAAR